MIQISKEEAKMIRERFPNTPVKRTVSKYYVEESRNVMNLLKFSQKKGVK